MDYKYINTEYLEMVAGGDVALLKELIGLFRDQVAEFNQDFKVLLPGKELHCTWQSGSQSQIIGGDHGDGQPCQYAQDI